MAGHSSGVWVFCDASHFQMLTMSFDLVKIVVLVIGICQLYNYSCQILLAERLLMDVWSRDQR